MKIIPKSAMQINLETETGAFRVYVYETTDGGLEIISEEGKIFVVETSDHDRRVVIHNAEKPSV